MPLMIRRSLRLKIAGRLILDNVMVPPGIPLFSTKGSTGHTLAAAGLMQLAAAVMMLKEQVVPPQTSLETPEEGAENMVAREVRPLLKKRIISMNAGFGGLNGALLLEACEA